MPQPTVLISGAGIAGPALAFWLNRSGYRVTVVELADGIRPGGQTVDLRGAGGDVVEHMGLMDQMRHRSLDQRGVAWIKAEVMTWMQRWPFRSFAETKWFTTADSIDLPEYASEGYGST